MAKTPCAPVKGKICGTVPQVMQMEALECGAACLTMICAYYGKWIPLEQVRRDCGVSRDGSKASKLVKAARSYGLNAKGFRCNADQLGDMSFPAIIHWEFNHFVVLRGIKNGKAYLNDPARGEVTMPLEDFEKSYTGIILQLSPAQEFQPSGHKPSIMAFLAERLEGSAPELVFVVAVTALVSILGLISPLLSQTFLDKLIGGQNPSLVVPFFVMLVAVSVLQVACSLLSSLYLRRSEGKLAAVGSASFMWKLFQLPVEFFSQRTSGDLNNRLHLNSTVASALVNTLAPIFIQFITAIVCLVMMLVYNAWLAAFGIIASVLKILIARVVSQKRINYMRVMSRDAANMAATTVAGFQSIESLKASGATRGFFRRWSGYQASANNQQASMAEIGFTWGLLPEIISGLLDASIVVVGVYLIMTGDFTVGALAAFQGILAQFAAPLSSLITAMQTFQETTVDMERIQDVMHYPVDDLNLIDTAGTTERKLSGKIEMRNVTFGYSRLEKPLIEGFNLEVRPGGCVAFVGPSGCGKSTLAKLISGLYAPWSGEITFDGTPLPEVPRAVRNASVSVVDQDIVLFGASVRENITLWDDTIPNFTTVLAARDVEMHDVIMERPGGYEYVMSENGMDFSGGQRQRLEIARALAVEPTIMVLDEATSALDTKTELKVMQSIKDNGITTVLVTHRLSAIRDCDEIIVLDQGKVIQRGSHEQLIEQGGLYAQLVSEE